MFGVNIDPKMGISLGKTNEHDRWPLQAPALQVTPVLHRWNGKVEGWCWGIHCFFQ